MPTQLDHYRLLGRSGLRVSPLCLGTMTFGTDWPIGAPEEDSRKVFDAYVDRGGNFIDTADIYTNGTSEKYVGKFMGDRRDQFVLATKYTFNMQGGDANSAGNHRKHMRQAVEASLQRLGTDYIDLYWVHAYDGRTPIDETMRALDDLVKQGKILYVGISDCPAWKVAEANTIALLRGWSPFIALQIEYSLVERTVERDLIPMAIDFDLGVTPWSPLGQGVLTGKYLEEDGEGGRIKDNPDRMDGKYVNDHAVSAAKAVVEVAKEIGKSPAQVALSWLLHQPAVVSPIVGARKVHHLEDNLDAVTVDLSDKQIQKLDEATAQPLGFPHEFLNIVDTMTVAKNTVIDPPKGRLV
ncbi:MAG: aldo/keto reductase [Planctomycetota bacterium]